MTDEPNKDNGDYLGYGVYADTLWSRIEAALNKDQGKPEDLGDDPLVVGIFGEWGAGKSTLLKLVRRRAQAAAEQASQAQKNVLTVPVYFQPWKYEHEKHLLVPLVLHVVEAAREALKRSPTVRQQLAVLSKEAELSTWKWGRRAHETAKTARRWFPVVKKIVGSLSVFGVSIALPDEIDDWLKDAEAVFESPEAKEQQRKASAKELRAKKLSFVDNGFHYYELHELLTALTRPGNTDQTDDLTAQRTPAKNLRINFVVFIDDLDRCLPEKAVETLELIKTVFNLESFAFVLALDEEVVERGIGHRYKDYALVNKKPEMPITGFEYLEKIVHLPFRLPPLTAQQGLMFLQRYEIDHVLTAYEQQGYTPSPWMQLRDVAFALPHWLRGPTSQDDANVQINLAALVINSFDAYVPRKLVRVVELFHQTLAVLYRRQRLELLRLGGEIDPRVLMAFVMLQLFQPDLYRACRRSLIGFNVLLDATAEPSQAMREARPASQALGKRTADADLWHWAVGWIQDKPPVSQRAALMRLPDLPQSQERHDAQRIQLPLAARLVEHREAQRHVFDPLRLFEQLRFMHQESGNAAVNSAAYFAVLALAQGDAPPDGRELEVLHRIASAPAETAGLDQTSLSSATKIDGGAKQTATGGEPAVAGLLAWDVDELYAILATGQAAEKQRLYEKAGLQAGQTLPSDVERSLLARAQQEHGRLQSGEKNELLLWRSRVLKGLSFLAPHFDRPANGADWLALVESALGQQMWGDDHSSIPAVQVSAEWGDLRALLGQDDRFNPQRFHLPRQRFNGHTDIEEPIEGFVRVPKGAFDLGAKGKGFGDNPLQSGFVISSDFYIARYLTTVDQYAQFVEAGGYGGLKGVNPGWWDTLGWQWRTGQWDSLVKEKVYREHLARRKTELRGEPMNWAEQQAHGSRPVIQLTWFEARAYANWLTIQLRAELDAALPLPGYAVRLPTEAQWERAARSKSRTQADERQYPWGGADEKTAQLHANIGASKIGRPSPVGLFAPNPLGLCDLSGNVWEWQNNLYQSGGEEQDKGLNTDVTNLMTNDELDQCDLPALRGGAWGNAAEYARASIRRGIRPVFWSVSVGCRVVLSLPN